MKKSLIFLLLSLMLLQVFTQNGIDPVRKLLNTSDRVLDSLNEKSLCYEYDEENGVVKELRIFSNGNVTIKYGQYDRPTYLSWVNPPFSITKFESNFIIGSKWYLGPWSEDYSFRKGGNFIELKND